MDRTPPLVVSYATPAYHREAAGLEVSLDAHGIEHRISRIENQGGWVRNCAAKAGFMAEHLADPELRERGVLWLDADARVRQPLDALWSMATCTHVAAHWRDGQELLSGTLLMRGEPGLQLARQWAKMCSVHPEQWDQRTLALCIHAMRGIVIGVLPAEYCWIERFMGHEIPREAVVIEHRQASRELRDAEEPYPDMRVMV